MRFLLSLIFLSLLPVLFGVDAGSLTSIKHHINQTRLSISRDQRQRNTLNQQLAIQEKKIARLEQQQKQSQTASQSVQKTMLALTQQQKQFQQQLDQQQKRLRQLLLQGYAIERQPWLKRLLNAQSLSQSQLLLYYKYLSRKQLSLFQALHNKLAQLRLNEQQLQQQETKRQKINQQRRQQKSVVQRLKKQREHTILTLNAQIKSKRSSLQVLINNQIQLEKALQKLKTPSFSQFSQFSRLAGKLSWPTRGKIIKKYGTQIASSKLIYKGVLIQAPEGQVVHAIANGDVVFARWLSGYGQLIIINHGGGYMSLYGRNQRLAVKQGDRVSRGQKIAWVGNSGGFKQSALYFSLRHNRAAMNPSRWCVKHGANNA